MSTSIPILKIRKLLGRTEWGVPEEFGPEGWMIKHLRENSRIIITVGPSPDPDFPGEWLHASISHADRMPDYSDLKMLHAAVWSGTEGWAYQVFAPPSDHVNFAEHALHLWGQLNGAKRLPNFGVLGMI